MVKIANALLLELAIAPVIFLVVALLLELGGRESRNKSGVCSSDFLCSDLAFSSSDRDYLFRSNQQEPNVRKGEL